MGNAALMGAQDQVALAHHSSSKYTRVFIPHGARATISSPATARQWDSHRSTDRRKNHRVWNCVSSRVFRRPRQIKKNLRPVTTLPVSATHRHRAAKAPGSPDRTRRMAEVDPNPDGQKNRDAFKQNSSELCRRSAARRWPFQVNAPLRAWSPQRHGAVQGPRQAAQRQQSKVPRTTPIIKVAANFPGALPRTVRAGPRAAVCSCARIHVAPASCEDCRPSSLVLGIDAIENAAAP